VRRGRGLPRKRKPGALYWTVADGQPVMSGTSARKLGRRAARDHGARRFLFDVVSGRFSIPPDEAAPALRELVKAEPEWVVSLLRCRDPSAGLAAGRVLGRAGSAFRTDLLAATEAPEASARLAGVAGLAELAAGGSEEAVEALAIRLKDGDGQVRWAAAAALGRARPGTCATRAASLLEQVIEAGEERALSGAVFGVAALWRRRRRDAARLLLRAADAGQAGIRAAAAAMRELPRRAAHRLLARCVEDEDPDVRALCAAALGQWAKDGSGGSHKDLERLARDPHAGVRAAAAEALLSAGTGCSPHLVDRLAADGSALVRLAVAEALSQRPDQAFASVLWPLAGDSVPSVSGAAVRALGPMGMNGLVREACRDRSAEVRAAAASVIDPATSDDIETLLALAQDRDTVVVRSAARALGRHSAHPRGRVWDRIVELACDTATAGAAAAGMAAALDRDPDSSGDVFWEWPVGSIAPDVLAQICRLARSPVVAGLAWATGRALEPGGDLGESLDDLAAAFDAGGRGTTAEAVLWLADCLAAESLAQIGEASARPPDAESSALTFLAAAGRAAAAAERVSQPAARERHLTRALAAVQACLDQDARTPQWVFAHRIAARWRDLIGSEAATSRPISARLASSSVIAGPQAALLVEVENRSMAPVPGISVHVRGRSVRAPDLPPGGRTSVEVPLAAAEPGVVAVRGRVEFGAGDQRGASEFEGTARVLRAGRVESAANPYVVGKPLGAESAMFFGRAAELAYVERALESGDTGSVVVLVGQRRTGKTSLLRRLEARLGYRYQPVFVDVQGMLVSDTQAFFEQLAGRARAAGEDAPAVLSDGEPGSGSAGAGAESVRAVADSLDRRVVLLLDEFDDLGAKVSSGRLSEDVFAQLRNLMQHSANVSLVVSGTPRLEKLAGEHWSFLLNLATYRRVGCLDRPEAEDVLRVPLSQLGIVCEDAAVSRALALTGCHPYFLQLFGYRLVEQCVESGEGAVRATLVEQVADDVVEQGQIHLRYLWESAGAEGQPMVRMLAASEAGVTAEEVEASAEPGAASRAGALRALSDMELIHREEGRWKLRIGLLSRWVRECLPPAERGSA